MLPLLVSAARFWAQSPQCGVVLPHRGDVVVGLVFPLGGEAEGPGEVLARVAVVGQRVSPAPTLPNVPETIKSEYAF